MLLITGLFVWTIMMKNKIDRSSIIVTLALVVGLSAQLLAGPLAGLLGAAIAATVSGLAFRYHDQHAR
jgi:hypothetical protein